MLYYIRFSFRNELRLLKVNAFNLFFCLFFSLWRKTSWVKPCWKFPFQIRIISFVVLDKVPPNITPTCHVYIIFLLAKLPDTVRCRCCGRPRRSRPATMWPSPVKRMNSRSRHNVGWPVAPLVCLSDQSYYIQPSPSCRTLNNKILAAV